AASRASLTLDGGADLQRAGTYLGQPLRGALRLALRADGRLDDVRAQASATEDDAGWRDVAATPVVVRADLRGRGGAPPAGPAEADASGLRWDPNAPVAARAAVAWQRSRDTDRASITLSAVGAGGRTQDAALTVVRSPGATEGTLERLVVTPPV